MNHQHRLDLCLEALMWLALAFVVLCGESMIDKVLGP